MSTHVCRFQNATIKSGHNLATRVQTVPDYQTWRVRPLPPAGSQHGEVGQARSAIGVAQHHLEDCHLEVHGQPHRNFGDRATISTSRRRCAPCAKYGVVVRSTLILGASTGAGIRPRSILLHHEHQSGRAFDLRARPHALGRSRWLAGGCVGGSGAERNGEAETVRHLKRRSRAVPRAAA